MSSDDARRMVSAYRVRAVPDAATKAALLARLHAASRPRRPVVRGAIAVGVVLALAAAVLLSIAGLGRLLVNVDEVPANEAVDRTSPPTPQPVVEVPTTIVPPAGASNTSAPIEVVSEVVPQRPVRRIPPARTTTEPASTIELSSEAALLAAAQTALRDRDPARALELLTRHATRFASGEMAIEREALRVIALCELRRHDEGRAAATAVLADPRSRPYAARIRRACE